MFPFKERIHTPRFIIVLSKGKKVFSKLTSLTFLENNLSLRRFSVVVSKSVCKKAHDRNLLKRRIREILKEYKEKFPPNKDFIVFAGKGSAEAVFDDLKKDIQNLINHINS